MAQRTLTCAQVLEPRSKHRWNPNVTHTPPCNLEPSQSTGGKPPLPYLVFFSGWALQTNLREASSYVGCLRPPELRGTALKTPHRASDFLQLQQEIVDTENRIAFARQYYNDTVREWNTKIDSIPYNFFAGRMNARKAEYFEIQDITGAKYAEALSPEDTTKPPSVEF